MIKEENRAYSDFEPRVFCDKKYSYILPKTYVPKKNITVPLTPDCKKEYDDFGRVVYAYSTFINSNKKYEEFFITYDKNGNITSVEKTHFSAKIIENLEYDEFGNLVKVYDNLGNKRVIKYDKNNNILSDECSSAFNLMEYMYFYYDDHSRIIKIEYWHAAISSKQVEEWSYYDDNSIKHYKKQGAFDEEYYFNEDGIKVIAEGSKIQYTYKTSYKRIEFEVLVNADNSYDIYSLSGPKASISKNGTGFIYMDGKKYTLSVEETNVELPAESDNASIVYFTSTFGSFYYYGFNEIHTHHHIYDDSGKLIGDLYTTKETKKGDIYIPVFGTIYKYNEHGKIKEERLIHNCINTDFGKEQYNKIVYI